MSDRYKSTARESKSQRERKNKAIGGKIPGSSEESDTVELPSIASTDDLTDIVQTESSKIPKLPQESPAVYYLTQENDNPRIYTSTSNPARMGEFEIRDKRGQYSTSYEAEFATMTIKEEMMQLGLSADKIVTFERETSQKNKGDAPCIAAVKVTATDKMHQAILQYLRSADYKDSGTKRQKPTGE